MNPEHSIRCGSCGTPLQPEVDTVAGTESYECPGCGYRVMAAPDGHTVVSASAEDGELATTTVGVCLAENGFRREQTLLRRRSMPELEQRLVDVCRWLLKRRGQLQKAWSITRDPSNSTDWWRGTRRRKGETWRGLALTGAEELEELPREELALIAEEQAGVRRAFGRVMGAAHWQLRFPELAQLIPPTVEDEAAYFEALLGRAVELHRFLEEYDALTKRLSAFVESVLQQLVETRRLGRRLADQLSSEDIAAGWAESDELAQGPLASSAVAMQEKIRGLRGLRQSAQNAENGRFLDRGSIDWGILAAAREGLPAHLASYVAGSMGILKFARALLRKNWAAMEKALEDFFALGCPQQARGARLMGALFARAALNGLAEAGQYEQMASLLEAIHAYRQHFEEQWNAVRAEADSGLPLVEEASRDRLLKPAPLSGDQVRWLQQRMGHHPATRRLSRHRFFRRVVLLLLLLAAIGGGVYLWGGPFFRNSTYGALALEVPEETFAPSPLPAVLLPPGEFDKELARTAAKGKDDLLGELESCQQRRSREQENWKMLQQRIRRDKEEELREAESRLDRQRRRLESELERELEALAVGELGLKLEEDLGEALGTYRQVNAVFRRKVVELAAGQAQQDGLSVYPWQHLPVQIKDNAVWYELDRFELVPCVGLEDSVSAITARGVREALRLARSHLSNVRQLMDSFSYDSFTVTVGRTEKVRGSMAQRVAAEEALPAEQRRRLAEAVHKLSEKLAPLWEQAETKVAQIKQDYRDREEALKDALAEKKKSIEQDYEAKLEKGQRQHEQELTRIASRRDDLQRRLKQAEAARYVSAFRALCSRCGAEENWRQLSLSPEGEGTVGFVAKDRYEVVVLQRSPRVALGKGQVEFSRLFYSSPEGSLKVVFAEAPGEGD